MRHPLVANLTIKQVHEGPCEACGRDEEGGVYFRAVAANLDQVVCGDCLRVAWDRGRKQRVLMKLAEVHS